MLRNRIFTILSISILAITMCIGQIAAAPRETSKTNAHFSPVRGTYGDLWADIVLGKPGFGEMGPNEVTGSRVFNPGGVIIDRSVTPNRMYVYDGANSRVLGLHVGSQSGQRAELVLGQPGLDGHGACNGDTNYQNYPERAIASASTLCSMPEYQISPREGGSFANMAVDASGNLYVPDFDNHRVLLYLSPFDTDTVADDVWGQADFSGNECNRNQVNSASNSLCFRSPFNAGFVGGVGIDNANNLWVADNENNRVLRFPYDAGTGRPAHVANLVLGQPDFLTTSRASGMNEMDAPAAVRVNPSTGSVYVADSLNNRILIFNPPFSNGMAASGTLGSGLRLPTSIEFDPQRNAWVSDSANNQLLRFTPAGVVDRVLFKDQPTYSGICGGNYAPSGPGFYFPGPGTWMNSDNVCDSRGSIGIDSDGNIWASGSNFVQDVWRFPAPFPVPQTGIAHSADVQLFKPYILGERNSMTERSLADPRGIALGAGQLIISDGPRFLFWNDAPASLTNGKAADGVIGAPNFNQPTEPPTGPIAVDGQDQLWAMRDHTLSVYALPLTSGETPFYTLQPPVALKGGGSLTWGEGIAGMEVTANGDYLWLSDTDSHRVIRIATPLTNPTVDIVLGQVNASGNLCNQGQGTDLDLQPTANSLCFPASLSIDSNGNLFVSDHALESTGNHRLLEFDASLFPASPASALFGISASRVYGTSGSFTVPGCLNQEQDPLCQPLKPAFNQTGRMVVGLNSHSGKHFPLVYQNVLTNPLPVDTLKDYYSMPTAAIYDADGNLYVADQNRGRVLIYLAGTNTTHTISGNAGAAGVTLSYTDSTPKTATTDASGNYTFQVSDNWSGTVTPSKAGGVAFTPANRSYTNLTTDQPAQNYTATVTISGNAGAGGATLSYTGGGLATADSSGNYGFEVPYGWTGTVTPSKAGGVTFVPANRSYTNVTTDQAAQNYAGTLTISGNAGAAGATLDYMDGRSVTADGSGNYTFEIPYGWTGTVTPSKPGGATFTPANRSYTNITTDQVAQNYTATVTISGNADAGGATLSYTGGGPATADGTGNYTFEVPYGWTGTVTPSKAGGVVFTPTNRSYTNVTTDQAAQNYTATVTVSGNAGESGVTLSYTDGTAKTATSASNGSYSLSVSYGWTGDVVPSRADLTFSPPSISYTNLIANNGDEDYLAVRTFISDPDLDGWVLESTETSGVGGSINNSANTIIVGDDNSDRQYRSILSFATGAIPDNAHLQAAMVKVYFNTAVGTPYDGLGSIRVDIVKPFFGTTGDLQTGDFQATADVALAGTLSEVGINNWRSATLNTAGVNSVSVAGRTQTRLRFSTDDNNNMSADFVRFIASDYAPNPNVWPQLVVTYTIKP